MIKRSPFNILPFNSMFIENKLGMRQFATWILVLFLGVWHLNAQAHKPSDSYLEITIPSIEHQSKEEQASNNINQVQAQWDIALRDLDYAIGLDTNSNAEITWQEVSSKQQDIFAYALARLTISSKPYTCDLIPKQLLIDDHTDGAYAVILFAINCKKVIDELNIEYSLFSDIDPTHRGLLKLDFKKNNGKQKSKVNEELKITQTAIFSPDHPSQKFILTTPSRFSEFKEYVTEGVWHIWIGYDHILFLVSLLLPAVLVYSAKSWQPSQSFKTTFVDVLKVVTAFTIAHSITLTLATLHIIELPTRWVEAAIAGSVILAALNNLFPYLLKYRWLAAFAFGLIHGFGFAAVLADLGLQQDVLVLALIGFNIGVEIGQVGILCVFIPLAYLVRKSWFYKYVIFYIGSILIIIIAMAWFVERAFNLTIFQQI